MIATSAWAKRRHNSSLGVGLGGSGGPPAVPVVDVDFSVFTSYIRHIGISRRQFCKFSSAAHAVEMPSYGSYCCVAWC
ncbi:unnamed protein product, partial [Ixodes pacificus]